MRALVGVGLALCLASAARAEPPGTIRDGEHYFQVVIDGQWTPSVRPDGDLHAYVGPDGTSQLVISRIDLGRTRKTEQRHMIEQVIRGVAEATPGYRKIRQRLRTIGSVPVLDLSYRRTGELHQVITRFLFFRRHTVVLSVGWPAKAPRSVQKAAGKMIDSFVPFVP